MERNTRDSWGITVLSFSQSCFHAQFAAEEDKDFIRLTTLPPHGTNKGMSYIIKISVECE